MAVLWMYSTTLVAQIYFMEIQNADEEPHVSFYNVSVMAQRDSDYLN